MSDFVAHERSATQWWTAFSRHLTPSATVAFEGTDPKVIPARKVESDGVVSSYPDGTSATVLIETDAGQYQVLLVRETVEHPWFVDRVVPPETH
jgi:hypothetical protein